MIRGLFQNKGGEGDTTIPKQFILLPTQVGQFHTCLEKIYKAMNDFFDMSCVPDKHCIKL